jgi:hypothetical protein
MMKGLVRTLFAQKITRQLNIIFKEGNIMKLMLGKPFVLFLIIMFVGYITTSETVYSQSKNNDPKNTNEVVEGSGSIENTSGGYSHRGEWNAWPHTSVAELIILGVILAALIVTIIIVNNNDIELPIEGKYETNKDNIEPFISDTLLINTN